VGRDGRCCRDRSRVREVRLSPDLWARLHVGLSFRRYILQGKWSEPLLALLATPVMTRGGREVTKRV